MDSLYDPICAKKKSPLNYFEYYFRDKKSILRKNRNSIAVLDGKETKGQLTCLARDIFQYFGLGCRNVSKIFIPAEYDLTELKNYFKEFEDIIFHNKFYIYNINHCCNIKNFWCILTSRYYIRWFIH